MIRRILGLGAVLLLLAGRRAARMLARGERGNAPAASRRSTTAWMIDALLPAGLTLRRLAWAAVILGGLAAFAGGLVAASGIVSIKASSGHWAITEWFLHFAMGRSVATYSLGIHTPALDDPALVLRGAGHYEGGCRPCHGAVGAPSAIASAMLPPAPALPGRITRWKPREMFFIVKHGIKLSGMPAWTVQQRDDEVWAVVAFLRRLPQMDPEEYRRLAGTSAAAPELAGLPEADLAPPRLVLSNCARCHGVDGLGRGVGAFPKLAGQHRTYLQNSLDAYASGARGSGIMGPIASALSEADRRAAADYYASLAPGAPPQATAEHAAAGRRADEDGAIRRGEQIARGGGAGKGVPACLQCHGHQTGERNPAYPALAGQYPDYLEMQLKLFKDGHRGGSPYARLMEKVVLFLSEQQMHDVARYFASLEPHRAH